KAKLVVLACRTLLYLIPEHKSVIRYSGSCSILLSSNTPRVFRVTDTTSLSPQT
ncbi:hypothetical protein J6590_067655, partial [Homalodisca vitripennis]